MARLTQIDRKTVRRYVEAASWVGLCISGRSCCAERIMKEGV